MYERVSITMPLKDKEEIQMRVSALDGVNFSRACAIGAKHYLTELEKNSKNAKNVLALEKAKKGLVDIGLEVADINMHELELRDVNALKRKAYRKKLAYEKLIKGK